MIVDLTSTGSECRVEERFMTLLTLTSQRLFSTQKMYELYEIIDYINNENKKKLHFIDI